MSKLVKNTLLANKSISFKNEIFDFNAEGITNMEDEKAISICTLNGYTIVEQTRVEATEELTEDTEEPAKLTREELEEHTIAQLLRIAKDKNIEVKKDSKKSDIIAKILA